MACPQNVTPQGAIVCVCSHGLVTVLWPKLLWDFLGSFFIAQTANVDLGRLRLELVHALILRLAILL